MQIKKNDKSRSVIASGWRGAGERDYKGAEGTFGDGYIHYCDCGNSVEYIHMVNYQIEQFRYVRFIVYHLYLKKLKISLK